MIKNFQKILAISIMLIMLMAVTCYAEEVAVSAPTEAPADALVSEAPVEENKEAENSTDTSTSENIETIGETPEEEEEMLKGDLYLFQSTIDYKRTVDGNAYIMGNDITLNSMVGGDVFIIGNTVTIGKNSFIYGNLYVLANTLTIDGIVYGGDLYAACSEITISEGGAINRDMRVAAGKFTFNGGLGRNAFIEATELSVGENAIVYGDFNYGSKEAIQMPTNAVRGSINYNEKDLSNTGSNPVLSYLTNLVNILVLSLAILGVSILVAPKFLNKVENVEAKSILPSLGIGLLGAIITIPVAIILFITYIGVSTGFALIATWGLLLFDLSMPIAIIAIAGILANKVEALKKAHNVLAVVITSIVVWALGLIPYVGGIISALLVIFGFGLILRTVWKNRKTDEQLNS